MLYDEDLAEHVREQLAPQAAFEERQTFGGLALMVNTHMACGIVKDDLVVGVRTGPRRRPHGRRRGLDFAGRPMRGMVIVPGH